MRFRKNKHTWIPLEEGKEDDAASYNEMGAVDLNLSCTLDRIDFQSAIEVLPNGYKPVFLLHDIHGYDHREIAEMFGHSIGVAKEETNTCFTG